MTSAFGRNYKTGPFTLSGVQTRLGKTFGGAANCVSRCPVQGAVLPFLGNNEVLGFLLDVSSDGCEEAFPVTCYQQIKDVLMFFHQDFHFGVGDFQVQDAHP
jgi:hypothetical protein